MGNKISEEKKNNDSFENPGFVYPTIEEPCLISEKNLKYIKYIGQGYYGVVSLARWENSKGQAIDVAVKILKNASADAEKEALQEIKNMYQLNHLNIVRLYGITLNPIQVVVELCEGSLLKRLTDNTKPVLLVTQLLNYSQQICDGMAYLEKQRCIHRDLAARNVLLANNEEIVKISDFGLTRFLKFEQQYYRMQSPKGIPFCWCPPEAIMYQKFSHQSDVWSFGTTLWEIFTYGACPWAGYTIEEVLNKILSNEKLPKPKRASLDIYNIMCSCWRLEKEKRPSFFSLKPMLLNIQFEVVESNIPTVNSSGNYLEASKGDNIIIINENDPNIWFGQSKKTKKFGQFPRQMIASSICCTNDSIYTPIVKPMKNPRQQNKTPSIQCYEMPKSRDYVNLENKRIELSPISRTSILLQIEDCYFVMFPRLCDLDKLISKPRLDCIIGHPSKDVILPLNSRFENSIWLTSFSTSVQELQKQGINNERINLIKNYEFQNLEMNGRLLKIYKNQNGYAFIGSSVKVIYLLVANIQEQSKRQIEKLRPFDVAFFSIHSLKHLDEIVDVVQLVRAKETTFMIAKHCPLKIREDFINKLITYGIGENFIVLEENQSYTYDVLKSPS